MDNINIPNNKTVELFETWAGEKAISIEKLPPSGSYREYYRISSANKTAIGAYNIDAKENVAFTEFTKHFKSKNLNVPALYDTDLKNNVYLLEDLGDTTLFAKIKQIRQMNVHFPFELIEIYKNTLSELPKFQVLGREGLDFDLCYPRHSFDRQSMLWDCNYFKYYFLKLAKIPFDEQHLEDDFQRLIDYLLQADSNYFLYRDCQSSNIMLHNNKTYFIDYQGGRKGALQYDIASLLYDAKADVPQEIRTELLDFYISELQKYTQVDKEQFKNFFYGYVIIRIMQAMGAYGFRGLYEKKTQFLQSIPYALKNVEWLLQNITLQIPVSELWNVLHRLVESEELQKYGRKSLTLTINSFSYKKGIPKDNSGNGGGFVFDCRGLPNPGRYERYKSLSGKDESVRQFLQNEPIVDEFIGHIKKICEMSVDNYMNRKFANLMINFGCTGGQHRSVYCAEMISNYLSEKYDINLVLTHTEEGNWM